MNVSTEREESSTVACPGGCGAIVTITLTGFGCVKKSTISDCGSPGCAATRLVNERKRQAEDIAARLKRVVDDAHKAGLRICADSDTPAIRVLTENEAGQADIRQAGIRINVDDGCGGVPRAA